MIRYRFITFAISGILVLAAAVAVSLWGLKLGIDFTGGTLIEIEYRAERPSTDAVRSILSQNGIPSAVVQPTGERGFLIRTEHLSDATHAKLIEGFKKEGEVAEKRFDTIGPTIGRELQQRSVLAIILVILFIVIYIAWAFRKVSEPIASWKYGIATIVALIHDIAIPIGVFAVLGHFYGVEVDTLFVTALLTILGFSVHDTIVVFDRIRENLKNARASAPFEEVVGKSIAETIARSINTSFTVLLVLMAVYFFGGESVRMFSLALIIGVIFGTYSSIFLASPLLVTWNNWGKAK